MAYIRKTCQNKGNWNCEWFMLSATLQCGATGRVASRVDAILCAAEICQHAITRLLLRCRHHKIMWEVLSELIRAPKFSNKVGDVTVACGVSGTLLSVGLLSSLLTAFQCIPSLSRASTCSSFSLAQCRKCKECWDVVNVLNCVGCCFCFWKISDGMEKRTLFNVLRSKLSQYASFFENYGNSGAESSVIYVVLKM